MRDGAKTDLARQLRKSETAAEKRLWQALRDRRLDGHKFVRQATVGPYIADFLCRERKLIVELDGATHSSDADILSDRRRTAHLGRLGYKVVRLQNSDVLNAMDLAVMVIREALREFPSPAPRAAERPLPQSGRG
ncbi:MAG: endonuclease domain-containing protein [Aestuariivirga sp.]|uniref:endonuclease domain-containing protein n=1 Tax=Aestuariivirga sp. TaxID=2650926 RepID=UPI0025C0A0E0|nr:endonuclease domain-containing protein [Aestuariivirga sp.]MCA3561152.1 endonuclease domain-containing protein [Aestuariivirga sp.]